MSARDLGQQTSATVVAQPDREEGIVRAGTRPVHGPERPEDWGWHGETGKMGRIGAWFAVVVVILFGVDNHQGRVEDLWILGIAATMVVILLMDWRRRKNAWRAR